MVKLDKRQKLLLLSLCIGHIGNGLAFAIQAPFYPAVAASKGVSPTIIGLVFGINKMTSFLTSPFVGQHINSFGSKFLLVSGMLVGAICSILFGLLDLVNNKTLFIVFSFVIRIVEALGSSCYLTASISIGIEEFRDSMYVVSMMDTCYAIGSILSPGIGGFLFEVGGFITPFVTLGIFFMVSGILIWIILPRSEIQTRKSNHNVFDLIREFDFSLILIANFVGYYNMGFLDATLNFHLQQFNLSPAYVGLTFLATGASFAVFTPIWAYLGDKSIGYRPVVLMGSSCVLIAYLFLGPAPYIPYQASLNLTILALVINGSGISATSIISFIGAQKEVVKLGLPKDIATFGLVSGLWNSSLSLGLFIGPTCAGPLLEYFGFQNASLSVIILSSLLILVNLLRICFKKTSSKIDYGEVSVDEPDIEVHLLHEAD